MPKKAKPVKKLTDEQCKLVEDNIGLAINCASKMYNKMPNASHLEYDDVYAVACEGLCKAASGFDASKGFRFSTYAVNTINGYVNNYFKEHDGASAKFGRGDVDVARRIVAQNLQEWSDEEIAKLLGRNVSVVERARVYLEYSRPMYLDSPVKDSKAHCTLGEIIPAPNNTDPELSAYIKEMLAGCKPTWLQVLGLVYIGYTPTAAGRIMGVSKTTSHKWMNQIRSHCQFYETMANHY